MQLVALQYSKPLFKDADPLLIESQFGQLFGCLEHQRDAVGLMSAVTNFARYGSIVGVFSEWHPWAFRILQIFTHQGNVGLVHMRKLGVAQRLVHVPLGIPCQNAAASNGGCSLTSAEELL